MLSYTLTQLGNKSGEVTEAAFQGPVDITDRGKRKFVLVTAAEFDRLKGLSSQRRFHVDDLTAAEAGHYINGLASIDD